MKNNLFEGLRERSYGRFSYLEEVEQEVFEAMKKAAPDAVLSGGMAGWNSDGEDSECF